MRNLETSNQDTYKLSDRIVELETKFSHQDLLIEQLNLVITEQQFRIDVLEKKLSLLLTRLKETPLADAEIRPGPEKPPHY